MKMSILKKYITLVLLNEYMISILLFLIVSIPLHGFSIDLKSVNTFHDTIPKTERINKELPSYSKGEVELMLLKHELQKKRMVIIFTAITIAGLSMFLTLLFIDSRRKRKMLLQLKKIAESEAILTKERIADYERERVSKALYMATIDDTKIRLSETFNKIMPFLNEEGKKILRDALTEFDFKAEHDAWGEFELHFEKTHKSFYSDLLRLHPDLTPSERRMCAFIKLNLGTKEIAMIQTKSSRSIESVRYRLKKKMGLGENDSLSKYLNSL
jgi:DNA-binding CsgD family transcriptional regulator